MKPIWLEPREPLPAPLVALFMDLDEVLKKSKVSYLLTGAMAREILLVYGHGCPPGRKTNDVDFGVTLRDWSDFQQIQSALFETGRFRNDPRERQRIIHWNAGTGLETRVDLVPFGEIAGKEGLVAWPPDGSHVMRVLGYDQALKTAIRLKLDKIRWIPMASATGIALMKLVAWLDRGESKLGRDAVDFMELLRQYSRVLSDEELYKGHSEVLDAYDYNVELSAAFILGQQASRAASVELKNLISKVFEEDHRTKFLNHCLRERGFNRDEKEAEMSLLLESFEMGFKA